jgi:hypothetical protein
VLIFQRVCLIVASASACLTWPLAAASEPSPTPTAAVSYPSTASTDAPVGTNGSPVQVVECHYAPPLGGGYGSQVQVAIPFINVGTQTLTAVKFEMDLLDSFGSVIQREYGIVRGTFSPGVRIDPARPPLGGLSGTFEYQDNPGNAAFLIDVANPRDTVQVSCSVNVVLFDDGATWQRQL